MTFAELLLDELHRGGPASGLQLQQRLLLRGDLTWWQRLRLIWPPHSELRALQRRGQLVYRLEADPATLAARGGRPRFIYRPLLSKEPPP